MHIVIYMFLVIVIFVSSMISLTLLAIVAEHFGWYMNHIEWFGIGAFIFALGFSRFLMRNEGNSLQE